MERIRRRAAGLRLMMILGYCVVSIYLSTLSSQRSELARTGAQQGRYTIQAGTAAGTIYDRSGEPLVNQKTVCTAVVHPTADAIAALLPHVLDLEAFMEKVETGRPFVCEVDTMDIDCPDVVMLAIPERYSAHQIAQHIIGYTVEGVGVSGLEYAYDTLLRQNESRWEVTFSVDGAGRALGGELVQVRYGANPTWGVVTTLDARIQRICERAGEQLEKGCVVVMDVKSGDLLGLASFPTYSTQTLSEALDDPDSPMINRACYAYPVGSIFKLVTAACAYEQGIAHTFQWDCTGAIDIATQWFRCHDLSGHGSQNMAQAMRNSCNPYFISLSTQLEAEALLDMAKSLGFGEETALTGTMTASSGTLPTLAQMQYPAEKANFCFGQGVLTATPIQIARMTCAIAGDGSLPMVRLVQGETEDGKTVLQAQRTMRETGISAETAAFLRNLMCYTAADEQFQGRPAYVSMGAKTSTAQTGRWDEETGEEWCHGWVTAFFPADAPQYVVTVLAEDGGYGNTAAAPVLRQIAGAIMGQVE